MARRDEGQTRSQQEARRSRILLERSSRPERQRLIMYDVKITDNGTALLDGKEYNLHSFDMDGNEAITIPSLDLISYDEGETWGDME